MTATPLLSMQPPSQQHSSEPAILRDMAAAEDLAAADWHSACCQMFALYPSASAHFMHDVCNSIDLWISEEGLTPALADHLLRLISNERDASLKRHYEEWLHLSR